jgi:hypothetical protein
MMRGNRSRFLAHGKRLFTQSIKASSVKKKSSGSSLGVGLGLSTLAGAVAWYNGIHHEVIKVLSDPVLMPLLRLFDAETAHQIAVHSASYGLVPKVLCLYSSLIAIFRIYFDVKRCSKG